MEHRHVHKFGIAWHIFACQHIKTYIARNYATCQGIPSRQLAHNGTRAIELSSKNSHSPKKTSSPNVFSIRMPCKSNQPCWEGISEKRIRVCLQNQCRCDVFKQSQEHNVSPSFGTAITANVHQVRVYFHNRHPNNNRASKPTMAQSTATGPRGPTNK